MSSTGLDTFDTSIHATNRWLKVMMDELGTDSRHHALAALRAVLHAVRDRIGPENDVHIGAQRPMLLRGLYYERWKPSATPTRERHIDEFLLRVDFQLPLNSGFFAREAALAAFETIVACLPRDEVVKIIRL